MTDFSEKTSDLIIVRDQGKCARCGIHVAHLERGVAWAIHHRRPRGSGGTSLDWVNRPANGAVLCTGCHGWVESNRRDARAGGFLVSMHATSTAAEVPLVHALHGRVLLTDAGGWTPAGMNGGNR